MAALTAILSALGRVVKREGRTLLSVTHNNFFLVAALLSYSALASGQMPLASAPFFLVLILFLLFPASGDPLNKIPPTSLMLWPLTGKQRAVLRIASFGLSPIFWLTLLVVIVLRTKATLVFLGVMVCIRGLAFVGLQTRDRWAYVYPPRALPGFPTGFGRLLTLSLRQMCCLLDFYLAIAISMMSTAYRLFGDHPDPEAFPVLAILVALALSTYAQSLFGLDGPGGLTRYRILPLRGWQILLAKDVAYMAVICVLTLPLGLTSGITFTLLALAIGRYPSLILPAVQRKWRFTSGDTRFGAAQIVLASGMAIAASREGVQFLGIAFVIYAISLAAGAWCWDNRKLTAI